MKNVHIIKTNKPTRLHYYSFEGLALSKESLNWKEGRHIYITSDEEIKEGDYCYDEERDLVFQFNSPTGLKLYIESEQKIIKKIILTTDQDLIKDGVQSFSEDLYNFFINNPYVQNVEVKYLPQNDINNPYIVFFKKPIKDGSHNKFLSCCKTNEECHCGKNNKKVNIDWSLFPKSTQDKVGYNETLEEAAERIGNNFEDSNFSAGVIYGVIEGAKLREKDFDKELEVAKHLYLTALKEKEQMFNNEEVYQILNDSCEYIYKCAENGTDLELMPTLLKGFFQQYHK